MTTNEKVYLRPFIIKEGITDLRKGLTLKVNGELVVTPFLKEDGDGNAYLNYENGDFGISIYSSRTGKQFKKELHGEIDMLWNEYALAPDNKLSPTPIPLKQNLLKKSEEVNPKRISFVLDSTTDTAYFRVVGAIVDSYEEDSDGWIIRYDKDGNIQGVTIMDFSKEPEILVVENLALWFVVSENLIESIIRDKE
jgi:hypothetical protein